MERTASPARARGSAGFTLVEVAVALIIFAIGFLSLAAIIPAGTRGVRSSGQDTRASELAAAGMERLLATPFDDGELASGNHSDPGNPQDRIYYVTWVVEDSQPAANCKRITVTVRWPQASSTTQVRLVGVKTQAGG